MIKFFLGIIVGIILTMLIGIIVGAYRENDRLEKKIKEYEEKEKQ